LALVVMAGQDDSGMAREAAADALGKMGLETLKPQMLRPSM